MRSLPLAATQRRRLEELAGDSGITPHVMLRPVLRNCFELREPEANDSLAAERDATQRGYVLQAEARRRMRAWFAGIGSRRIRSVSIDSVCPGRDVQVVFLAGNVPDRNLPGNKGVFP